jgi:hypothetical protein
MRGLNVNGFVIVETLGSGRSGLLYLARHPTTGQEAIIRLAGNAEDGMTAKVFLEEATSLLPTARDVEPQVASDGSRVLMALGGSSTAPTEPLPQPVTDRLPGSEATLQARSPPAPIPGSGATQHPHTHRLGDSSLTRSAPLLLVFIGLAALAAAVTVLILVARRPAPVSVPVVVVPPAPPRPVVIAPPTESAPVPQPVVITPPSEPAPVVQPSSAPSRPVVARPAPAPAPKKTVVCDLRWQRAARTELAALRVEVARRDDDGLFRRYEDDEDRVVLRMLTLPADEECQAVDAALDALLAKYRP